MKPNPIRYWNSFDIGSLAIDSIEGSKVEGSDSRNII